MNHFAMQWYLKEEEKKKERMHASQTHLINNQLSNAIMRLSSDVEKEEYEEYERDYNQHLVQSNIWHLRYANNFDNSLVMFVQAAWIALILEKEGAKGNLSKLCYTEYEFKRILNQARMHDFSAYQKAIHLYPNLRNWI